jgi:hypothetical protein
LYKQTTIQINVRLRILEFIIVTLKKKGYSFLMRWYKIDIELERKEDSLLSCPFIRSCHLPQANEVCDFPNYKICPDYQAGLNKLKSTSKILH